VTRAIYLVPWRVDLTLREAVTAPVTGSVLARCIAAALSAAAAPSPASIGLILSDDAELAELNAAHLGKRGPTDVLSFPLLPPEAFPEHPGTDRAAGTGLDVPPPPGGTDRAAGTGLDFPLPPGQRRHLGDIVISVERAIEQAEAGRGGQTSDVRWSAADELRLLVTHGTLHICGWDHAEPIEETAMRALETRLLAPS
jgi:probable rRNA maturation factor